jgi:hypothetical protein
MYTKSDKVRAILCHQVHSSLPTTRDLMKEDWQPPITYPFLEDQIWQRQLGHLARFFSSVRGLRIEEAQERPLPASGSAGAAPPPMTTAPASCLGGKNRKHTQKPELKPTAK